MSRLGTSSLPTAVGALVWWPCCAVVNDETAETVAGLQQVAVVASCCGMQTIRQVHQSALTGREECLTAIVSHYVVSSTSSMTVIDSRAHTPELHGRVQPELLAVWRIYVP